MSRNPLPLGTISPARLEMIPKAFRAHHELCFHLHDAMLHVFHELAAQRFPSLRLNFEDQDMAFRFSESDDPIGLLMELQEWELVKQLTVSQTMMAVLGDFFNFVYEALTCLEKRKFVVFYALLRKPFKENLLYLTMMLVDDDEFFGKLKSVPGEKFNHPGVSEQDRKVYFKRAVSELRYSEFLDPLTLHDIIFDVKFDNGLAPLFDKATHLSTSRSQIRTEDLNLNFVFKDPSTDDVFDNVYRKLAYILLYALQLQLALFAKAGFETERLAKWYTLTGLGAYNALFVAGRCSIKDALEAALKDFLKCPHCESAFRIPKFQAARFFTSHKFLCGDCGLEHDFPLLWLLSQAEWRIFE